MISLGISPGIHALGYAVLHFNGAPRAELIDADILHAGRGAPATDSAAIERRSRAHRLVLDVVLNRNPPTVITLAPQTDQKELPEHVGIVRLGLMTLGVAFRIQVIDLGDVDDLYRALSVDSQRGLSARVRNSISGPVTFPRDKGILMAMAAAVAGAGQVLGN